MKLFGRVLAAFRFAGYYLWNILRASFDVALVILRPDSHPAPGIVRIPTRAERPWKVGAFAQLISLTPGTLTLDVAEDLSELYVHGLHVHSVEEFRAHLAELESRLLEVIG
ncbi:MAG: Na+/H+ antiporter subunit E [Nitriliruptorales bacterium]|nr:Na+/H+ antiporter subunit E [Nitriliruptorales bacterium]